MRESEPPFVSALVHRLVQLREEENLDCEEAWALFSRRIDVRVAASNHSALISEERGKPRERGVNARVAKEGRSPLPSGNEGTRVPFVRE